MEKSELTRIPTITKSLTEEQVDEVLELVDKLEQDDDVTTTICRNCCRDITPTDDKNIYICFADDSDCIYFKCCGAKYLVCSDCYETNNYTDEEMEIFIHCYMSQEENTEMKRILSKFKHSISKIS